MIDVHQWKESIVLDKNTDKKYNPVGIGQKVYTNGRFLLAQPKLSVTDEIETMDRRFGTKRTYSEGQFCRYRVVIFGRKFWA